ncbi:alpha/beta fold hydrolase [Microbacterium jiangjiandongii]|uniref:alpha/beta fold hydrolase n=1 Tax=Microbacterium jiangjiandongii TaxID=3049071 RepID=UPI0027D8E19A|nr:alpha/beta fold hydrolase [Microbacterium sp. zg.Y843]
MGSGPALLMIQGLGTDHRAWGPAMERLAPHLECISFDNRGVGAASDVGPETTMEDLADDAAELIDALGIGPVHVCGVSMGGAIAMRVASRHPHLVRSLALHSTAARPDPRLRAILDFRQQIVDTGHAGELLRPFVEITAFSPTHISQTLPVGATEIDKINAEEYAAHLRVATEQWMTDEELAKITAPTLVTVGTEDILTTPDNARDLYRGIAGAELLVVEGGGHAYYAESADLFASVQLGWTLRHAALGLTERSAERW